MANASIVPAPVYNECSATRGSVLDRTRSRLRTRLSTQAAASGLPYARGTHERPLATASTHQTAPTADALALRRLNMEAVLRGQ